MDNKEVLIINPLSDLMYNQYKNNNVYNANNITFSQIKNMLFYKNPYTFLNDGPHNNNIETVEDICNNISNLFYPIYFIKLIKRQHIFNGKTI